MKVPTVRPTATPATQRTQRSGPAGGPRFADHLEKAAESDGEVAGAGGVGGVVSVSSILSAQEVSDDGDQAARRQLAHRGEDLLDKLDDIRRDILAGGVSRQRLENLAQALRQRRIQVSDPRLIEIIDEIELRAAVEIAKLTRSI